MGTVRTKCAVGGMESVIFIGKGGEEGRETGPMTSSKTTLTIEAVVIGEAAARGVGRAVAMILTTGTLVVTVVAGLLVSEAGAGATAGMGDGGPWRRQLHPAATPAAVDMARASLARMRPVWVALLIPAP